MAKKRFYLSPNGLHIRDLKEETSYELTVENVINLLNKLNDELEVKQQQDELLDMGYDY